MGNIQNRAVGSVGLVKDTAPWQLPLPAWTNCLNVRFNALTASNAGVWKTSADLGDIDPVQVIIYHNPEETQDYIMVADRLTNGVYSVSGQGATASLGTVADDGPKEAAWTWTVLADVLYVNREDAAPAYLLPGSETFQPLGNMGSAWTCLSLRSYKDFLIALNISEEDGTSSDNSVKWSDATLAGQIPADWGQTQTVSSLGGDNVLAQMVGPIVDGLALADNFIIYGRDEVWAMEFIDSGTYPFTFRRLFGNGGMKSQNCAVEAGGYHYVLGRHDIYRHDGTQTQSLSSGRLNEWFWTTEFQEMPNNPCFVAHDEPQNEVMFFYQSQAEGGKGTGCNRALVYNYVADTWAMISAPNTQAGIIGLPNNSLIWDELIGSWDSQTQDWKGLQGLGFPLAFFVSRKGGSVLKSRMLTYDLVGGPPGGAIEDDTNAPAILERTGILLDVSQSGNAAITQAKWVQQVYPLFSDTGEMTVEVGQAYTPAQPVNWVNSQQYDPMVDWKVDTRANGRFLSLRFTIPWGKDWKFSGYDLTVTDGGSK